MNCSELNTSSYLRKALSDGKQFQRHYNALHHNSLQLLTSAKNEQDREHAIFTFVTPSVVPFTSLLDIHSCLPTLYNLLEILQPDNELPTKIKSPALSMETQIATPLEATILLTSLLIGAGYRAYVVQGRAYSHSVKKLRSEENCPYAPPAQQLGICNVTKKSNKYTVIPPKQLKSKYIAELKAKASGWRIISEKMGETSLLRDEKVDVSNATCLHFWTLVLPPNRYVGEPLFADITTKKLEAVSTTTDYKHIYSIFNHMNIWSCRLYNESITVDMFDLSNLKNWFSLYNETTDDSINKPTSRTISWSKPIKLTEKAHTLKFPNGIRKETYIDAKVEKFSQFTHPEGVVQCVYRHYPSEAHQYCGQPWKTYIEYMNRKDKLKMKIETFHGECFQYFNKARRDNLKEYESQKAIVHEEEEKTENVKDHQNGFKEIFKFYSEFRSDCLSSVSVGVEKFQDFVESCTSEDSEEELQPKTTQMWRASINLMKKSPQTEQQMHSLIETETKNDNIHLSNEQTITLTTPAEDNSHSDIIKADEDKKLMVPKKKLGIVEILHKVKVANERKAKSNVSMIRCHLKEIYEGRNDFLVKRNVYFINNDYASVERSSDAKDIIKIEEEYGLPSQSSLKTNSIKKRIFQSNYRKVQTISIIYHYKENRVLQATLSFKVPRNGKILAVSPEMVNIFQPDSNMSEPTLSELWEILNTNLDHKRIIEESIRNRVKEIKGIRTNREIEDNCITLESNVFQFESNSVVRQLMSQESEREKMKEKEVTKIKKDEKVDAISSYKILLPELASLSDVEAVRERCLEDLKKRLEIRANILQNELDKVKRCIILLRDDLSGRKRRLLPEERTKLTEKLHLSEYEHKRLRGFLATWRSESAHRYETLEESLLTDIQTNIDDERKKSRDYTSS